MRAQNDREGEPEPCHCAPCSSSRAGAAPTPLIVVGIVAINYIPNVLWSLEVNGASGGAVVAVIFFHFFVGLMVLAWAYTCFTDPGVPPERWQRQMAALAQAGQEVKVCRKSGLYKPARAHYCSVTRRLTLNMDHFCPWVVNTVGFYNKKFFVLFLLYACAAVAYSLAAIASQAAALFGFAKELGDDDDRWLPGALNLVLLVGAMVLDVVLLLVLGPFLAFHLKMAAKNQTTIDGDRYPQYELEVERNLQSVLGRRARRGRARRPRASLLARISTLRHVLSPPPHPRLLLLLSCHLSVTSRLSPAALPAPLFSLALSLSPRRKRWTWLLPCYCAGPDGDGVHWPTSEGGRTCTGNDMQDRFPGGAPVGIAPGSGGGAPPVLGQASSALSVDPGPSSSSDGTSTTRDVGGGGPGGGDVEVGGRLSAAT